MVAALMNIFPFVKENIIYLNKDFTIVLELSTFKASEVHSYIESNSLRVQGLQNYNALQCRCQCKG